MKALVVDGLVGGGFVGEGFAGAGNKSVNDQGRGTKWSVAGEVVWRDGDGGLWRHKVWETLGTQTPTKTCSGRFGQTASGAWAGTAHLVSDALTLMRGTTVFANWH